MENTPRYRRSHIPLLIIFFVMSIFSASLFFGSAYFIYSKKPSLSRLSAELSGIADEEEYYRGLKKTISDTQGRQGALSSYFIDPDNFVPFVEEIEALGTHSGAALAVESAALADNNRNLALTLSARGTFEQTLYFLSLLEAFPAKVTFDRAWIAKGEAPQLRGEAIKGQSSPLKQWEGRFILRFASI